LRIFHYALDEERDVGFGLYEDAAQYDAHAVDLDIPMLVFQGRQDDTVDPAMVEQWASGKPNVDLRLCDDGHQLGETVDTVWNESRRFMHV